MTTVTYRKEPGRLVMQLAGIDLTDRVPEDEASCIEVDLGRTRVHAPQPLDWDPKYVPVTITADPQGRVWTAIYGTDTGTACELSTPMEGT